MNPDDKIHLLGIRHHGPGSARSLLKAFAEIQPDVILLEGPAEAEAMLALATHADMRPPVALLLYEKDNLANTVFYPFAEFSPEWQVIHYAQRQNIPLKFMDLPQTHQLALRKIHEADTITNQAEIIEDDHFDPLTLLAQAAGFSDGERWWEYMVEQRQGGLELFQGIQEALTALRESLGERHRQQFEQQREQLREAWMRKTIRIAVQEGYQRIAVICGAWHVPALITIAKQDEVLLKKLPKTKVETTWVPWSNNHLTYASGYGAGMISPGWYQHLWECHTQSRQVASSWLTKIAHLLREEGIDASTASVIESVRLAETLAALRQKPLPDLEELNEASLTTLCFGDSLPMQLIQQKLIVGENLGEVPSETPSVPLQQDLARWQKKLRLTPSAVEKDLELDLRKDTDLERSQLLHRLNLLKIPWGELKGSGKTKGTFKEIWRLQWQPEFAIQLIEASVWGVTVEAAATEYTCDCLKQTNDLAVITPLVDQTLLANLPIAVDFAMTRLAAEAAVASDVLQLMASLPSLAKVLRYGNIRRHDSSVISRVIDTLVTRVTIGLPNACSSLDNDAASEMYRHLVNTDEAIKLLANSNHLHAWQEVLHQLLKQEGLHGLIAGRSCRLLFNGHQLNEQQVAQRMSLALSKANDPLAAGAWVDGFLRESGLILLLDEQLWAVLNNWIGELSDTIFLEILPLLRRTFATFPTGERRQLGERIKQPVQIQSVPTATTTFADDANVVNSLSLIVKMLGLDAIG
jgi:hypothetical protein